MAQIATYKVSPRALVQLSTRWHSFCQPPCYKIPTSGFARGSGEAHGHLTTIAHTAIDATPVLLSKGHVIAAGVLIRSTSSRIASVGAGIVGCNGEKERKQADPSLKIAFNNVFGTI